MQSYHIAFDGYTVTDYASRGVDLFDLFAAMLDEFFGLALTAFDGHDAEAHDAAADCECVGYYDAETRTLVLRVAGMFD